jgi:hypothetical protein
MSAQVLPMAQPGLWSAGLWQAQAEAAVGLAHRAKDLPCQDAALARAQGCRPVLVVADGAGSSPASDLGAQATVVGLVRLVHTLERQWGPLLDEPQCPTDAQGKEWALLLVKHARGLLTDLAHQHRRSVRDVRCTLLMTVVGEHRALWLRVGDGALVVQELTQTEASAGEFTPVCRSLGEAGKGEFANETVFLDSATPDQVQWGWLNVDKVCGLAAMSDGAAEKLVSLDGSRVAGRMSSLLGQLAADALPRQQLTRMFYEPDFCLQSTGDDRCLALLARTLMWKPAAPHPPAPAVSPATPLPAPKPGEPGTGTAPAKVPRKKRGSTAKGRRQRQSARAVAAVQAATAQPESAVKTPPAAGVEPPVAERAEGPSTA